MKNFVRSWSVLLAFLGPLALSVPARATVVWTATFEKAKSGDICSSAAADSEFKPGVNETKGTRTNAEVLGEKVYSGNLACKITVHPDDTFTFNQNRVDIQHPSTLTDEGKDSYLSGHYMMPADAQVRNEIGFYESNKSFANAMDIWVAPKVGAGGGTTINFAIGFLPTNASWTADFKAGVWHQVAIHVHWSQTATTGYADIWLDGVKTVPMLKGKTKPNADTLFYQTGLHRKLTSNNTDVIYLDDFIEADTEAEIMIAAPGAPSDGGTSGDATGAAGTSGAAGTGGAAGSGAAGTSGAAGSGAAGATGAAGTGAAGSGATGAAGSGTGAAGAGSGAAGSGATGAAGTGATGAAGTTGGGASGAGCSCAVSDGKAPTMFIVASLASLLVTRRRRARGHR
jgi:hypothetical protein